LNPNTSQGRASTWLIADDAYYICPDDTNLLQRYIMALFYYSTNGYNWLECSANILNSQCNEFRYLSTLNECVWYGNRCAGNDMYSIIFDNNGLSGTIPSEISNLSSLQEITLANNQISGTIPLEITSSLLLPSLRILDLNNNQLNGDM